MLTIGMAGNWSYFVKRCLLNSQQKHSGILTFYQASKCARFSSKSQLSVSLEDVEKFHTFGVVCLRRVFEPEWIKTVKKGIEKNIKNPSKFSEILQSESKASSKGYYFNDYCNWRKIDEFKDYVLNSPAAEIAGKLMKSKVGFTFTVIEY